MKNALFKILVWTLQAFIKKNPLDLDHLKVLVISTTGLGDSLWATPAFKEIKQKYPHAYLAVLTTKLGKQVFLNNPHIDQIYLLEKFFSFRCVRLWRTLLKNRFQIVFQFHNSQRYVLPFCALLGAQKIVGTQGLCKGLDTLLTDRVLYHPVHEIDRRLNLLHSIRIQASKSAPQYFLTEKEKQWIYTTYPKFSLSIGMHLRAKDGYKCWPISHFIKLGKLFEKHFNCHLYLTGSSLEKTYTEQVKNHLQNASSISHLSIRKFAALLSQMDLFISNDTGAMHLSCAMKTPTLGIFASTDPHLCGPTFEGSDVIYRPQTCTPCLKRKCNQPFCFYQLSPEMVFHQAKTLLSKKSANN